MGAAWQASALKVLPQCRLVLVTGRDCLQAGTCVRQSAECTQSQNGSVKEATDAMLWQGLLSEFDPHVGR
jgi:hypothetical protein